MSQRLPEGVRRRAWAVAGTIGTAERLRAGILKCGSSERAIAIANWPAQLKKEPLAPELRNRPSQPTRAPPSRAAYTRRRRNVVDQRRHINQKRQP